MEYVCNLCNYKFSSKQMLSYHQNKKTKCNIKTEFKCTNCKKCFKSRYSLERHIQINICENINQVKEKKEDNTIDKAIEDIITNDSSIEDKIFILKTFGIIISEIEIKKILESKFSISTKVLSLKNTINNKSIITNTNSNNTVNNININNFGNENIDYLTPKYFENLLKNNYGKDSLLKLSNEIYLNKDRPNNNTIKIDNLNNKYCKIIENNKWITTTKESALRKIFLTVSDLVLLILDDVKDKVPEKRRQIISDYLEKDFEDEYIKETITEFILNIYNFTINEV